MGGHSPLEQEDEGGPAGDGLPMWEGCLSHHDPPDVQDPGGGVPGVGWVLEGITAATRGPPAAPLPRTPPPAAPLPRTPPPAAQLPRTPPPAEPLPRPPLLAAPLPRTPPPAEPLPRTPAPAAPLPRTLPPAAPLPGTPPPAVAVYVGGFRHGRNSILSHRPVGRRFNTDRQGCNDHLYVILILYSDSSTCDTFVQFTP
ncbi:hypothetical protein NDU88_005585 [Pleurodeles waltl]|uniref:Uncharacterized protein n=1 Tax=Pleurodeles waltl TaxID=8319 RepID=A0AAV7M9R9_PLEWA|nr:hypothetical protein NDU88_005585 [Pleurodeles waltl]